MPNYKYKLEPYKGIKSRYTCPACGKRNKFTRYIDTETGDHLSETTGKCDRELKCGYHQTPGQYFQATGKPYAKDLCVRANTLSNTYARTNTTPCSYLAYETLLAARTGYETNCFVNYLLKVFDADTVNRLIADYEIGSSTHWPGATIFWQLDKQGHLRTGKIMLYNATTGKRVKQPFNHVAWVHTLQQQSNYNLQQCLFGEHLLSRYPTKPVALVESEKTAIIASAYLPEFVWLATGGLQGLNAKRLEALKYRTVTLFPDQKGYDTWVTKAAELTQATRVEVSTMLEENLTPEQKSEGLDLADWLLQYNYRQFIPQPPITVEPSPAIIPEAPAAKPQRFWQPPAQPEIENPPTPEPIHAAAPVVDGWDMETIENYFATYIPPAHPVSINSYSAISNVARYIDSHLHLARAHKNKPTYKPYYDRLVELMEWSKRV